MTLKEAIEEIKSDYIAKKICGDDYSESFKKALATLIREAKKKEKIA